MIYTLWYTIPIYHGIYHVIYRICDITLWYTMRCDIPRYIHMVYSIPCMVYDIWYTMLYSMLYTMKYTITIYHVIYHVIYPICYIICVIYHDMWYTVIYTRSYGCVIYHIKLWYTILVYTTVYTICGIIQKFQNPFAHLGVRTHDLRPTRTAYCPLDQVFHGYW